MTFVRAQGNFRSKPDGFLHVWNFAATRASGMAGAVVNHIVDDRQRDIIEMVLIQRASQVERDLAESPDEYKEIVGNPNHPKRQVRLEGKHNCWRFRKEFLIEHFKIAVYSSMYACGRNTAASATYAINKEYIQVVRENKLVANRDEITLNIQTAARFDAEQAANNLTTDKV